MYCSPGSIAEIAVPTILEIVAHKALHLLEGGLEVDILENICAAALVPDWQVFASCTNKMERNSFGTDSLQLLTKK